MAETAIWNFKQLAHHELDGFGGIGEGMSIQIAKDGRRILWLAHESAPKNFTGIDVSDPRAPRIVARTDLPQSRSPIRRRKRVCSPPASSCSTSRCRKTRARSPFSTAPARTRAASTSCGLPTGTTSI